MTEIYPTDSELNALSGTLDAEQEVLFVTTGESPYYTSFYKMLYRLLDVSRRAGDLRVCKDGDLTFGVRAGTWPDGDTIVTKAQLSAQSLTDNATNYIYYTSTGVLTVNTTGFPATPHLPLAEIATSAGTYDLENITDRRGSLFVRPTDGLAVTAGTETADEITITVQGATARQIARVWVAAADFGAPDATGNTVSIDTGTIYETETANAAYKVISDATGAIALGITVTGAATRYVMAEIDGQIYSSGVVTWAA